MKLNEGTFEGNSIAVYDGENGLTQIYKRGNGYYGINDDFDFHFESKAELEMMLKKWRYRLIAGGLKENKMKKLKESAMAELDIAAQEAPTFEAFVKTVKQEFPQLASDLNKPEVISFLQNMYDDAKMRENKTTMKKSQLTQLIREEIQRVLREDIMSPEMKEISKVLYKIAKFADANPNDNDDAFECIVGLSTEVIKLKSKDVDEMLNEGASLTYIVEAILDSVMRNKKPQIESKIKNWIRQFSNNFSSWKITI